ncbi:potassium-transporting ATPase subunit F [Salinisphaera sp. USBA-960]|nr:potassium-transporting ATPase subunit F [Salifodinibacter halophilus]NNC27021.1 potassium-transporting ATPase subunit F [Salifodinibacter halophilus]
MWNSTFTPPGPSILRPIVGQAQEVCMWLLFIVCWATAIYLIAAVLRPERF